MSAGLPDISADEGKPGPGKKIIPLCAKGRIIPKQDT